MDRLAQTFPTDQRNVPMPDCSSSGVHTATAQITSGPCHLAGFILASDGTADVTATVRNGSADDAEKLLPTLTLKAGDCGPVGLAPPKAIKVSTALRLVITGSGAEASTFPME